MDQLDFSKLQQFAQTNPIGALLIAGGVLVFFALLIVSSRRGPPALPPDIEHAPISAAPLPPPKPIFPLKIATMTEDVRMTGGGVFCAILLVLTLFVAFVSYMGAKTVFQQIEAGLEAVCGILLWGGGVALGRRKSYVIYNVPTPLERSEPKF